jgi:hypothetical protein
MRAVRSSGILSALALLYGWHELLLNKVVLRSEQIIFKDIKPFFKDIKPVPLFFLLTWNKKG